MAERKPKRPSRVLAVGQQAPDFALPDQGGNTVILAEFQGKKNVVLVFYPADGTPGCTRQLCAIRDEFDVFTKRDTVVFGINPQDSAAHQKFAQRHGFPFPLLVDRDREVVAAYGCKGMVITKRTVYGIDKKGIIVFVRRGTPFTQEILQAFKE